jgi:hypothetical protein
MTTRFHGEKPAILRRSERDEKSFTFRKIHTILLNAFLSL